MRWGRLDRCIVVQGGGRRFSTTHDALGHSGGANGFHFIQLPLQVAASANPAGAFDRHDWSAHARSCTSQCRDQYRHEPDCPNHAS